MQGKDMVATWQFTMKGYPGNADKVEGHDSLMDILPIDLHRWGG